MLNFCQHEGLLLLPQCPVFTILSLQYVVISNVANTPLTTLNGIALHLWNNVGENCVLSSNTGKKSTWRFSVASTLHPLHKETKPLQGSS